MGIYYSVAIGVGVDNDEITYNTLTDYAKKALLVLYKDNGHMEKQFSEYYDDEQLWDLVPEDELKEALSDFFDDGANEYAFMYDIGLSEYEGNLYSGWIGYRGVGINLNIETIKQDVENAIQEFKKVVNLEPVLFSGVLVS